MQLFGSSRICRPQEELLSAGRVRVHTCCECYNKRGYIRTWYVYQKFIFHFPFDEIYQRLLFFTLGRSVSAWWIDYSTTINKWKMKRTAGWSCSVFFSFSSNSLAKATWWWMLLYRTLRKVPGTTKVRLWEKYVSRDFKMCCCCCRFCCGAPTTDEKNTRTGTPWCIAEWLLQVFRSRLITTNY